MYRQGVLWDRLSILILIVALVVAVFFIIYRNSKKSFKDNVEILKSVVETLAFFLAGLYFLYQIGTSITIVNLDLSIATERQALDKEHDYLKVTLGVKKGNINSLYLHEIMGRVRVNNQKREIVLDFDEYFKLGYIAHEMKFDNWKVNKDNPRYQLGTEEATQFAAYTVVPARKVCRIDIAVLGGSETLQYGRSQWRISAVVLPVDTANKE
jgi:hypothetical protein